MRRMESIQTASARPRRLTNLDVATQGESMNPMAPSHIDPEPKSNDLSGNPRPKPRLITRGNHVPSDAASQLPSVKPTFSMAVPGQPFGFRLPGTGQTVAGQPGRSNRSVTNSTLESSRSRTSSVFSGNSSQASTAPTSRSASVCPLSQGDLGASQQPHTPGLSSHLKMLALASQCGVEAPARISRVSPGSAASQPPNRPLSLLPDSAQGTSSNHETSSPRCHLNIQLFHGLCNLMSWMNQILLLHALLAYGEPHHSTFRLMATRLVLATLFQQFHTMMIMVMVMVLI